MLWIVLARRHVRWVRMHPPTSLAFKLLPIVSVVLAVHYVVLALAVLSPSVPLHPFAMLEQRGQLAREVPWIVTVALLRHIVALLPLPERRPSPAWLAFNYGLAGVAVLLVLALRLRPDATPDQQVLAHRVYEIVLFVLGGLTLLRLVRAARPGSWGPEHAGELRRPDAVMILGGIGIAVLAFPVAWGIVDPDFSVVAFEVALGLAVAVPMALRSLGAVAVDLATLAGVLLATGAVVAAVVTGSTTVEPSLHPLLVLGATLGLWGVLTIGQDALRAFVARRMLRRTDGEWGVLQDFLHTLSPERGVQECCRLALAELLRMRRFPGAAILLDDGRTVVAGTFHVEPIERVWPRGEAAAKLPTGVFGSNQLRMLPVELRDALREANVGLGSAVIASPRRRWGHLFIGTGMLGGFMLEEDSERLMALTDQLALLLDASDLLGRTVAVERSLAHAEKLAAIGELAARVAHEIRNPVTAARSLAQQLARAQASPLDAEHAALIVEELERVERQVRDLLRFARRDELRLEAVDLPALLEAIVTQLRARLEAARVQVTLAADPGSVARCDREKLRQVVINLIENAVDALGERPGTRRIALSVAQENGHVRLRVADDGPGVAPEDVPHLFEPFFSTKEHGTGLGLAIVRRTIEAHGGRIEASAAVEGGLAMTIELPAAGERAA
jgi:signal transduction histidine kinase